MMKLSGKVAIVTGGSQGIGLATMRALAGEGAYVVSLARDGDNLRKAIESVHPDFRQNVTGIPTDVRNEEDVRNAVSETVSLYGKIDILINAAGVSMRERQSVQEIELAEWRRIIDTNLTGTFLMCREVLLRMAEKNSGYIINILSTAAFQASGGDSAYAASKFGARALTEAMIAANRKSGIRVTSISPGAVNTNIWNHKTRPVSQEQKEMMLKPEEIADIVLFLLTRPPAVHIENITVTSWKR
jgi:3-oxoacyl-[acyl-carrier protein] reductase